MKYSTIENKLELQRNLDTEYKNSDSIEEFMMNCVVKYGYNPNKYLNWYWWFYTIKDKEIDVNRKAVNTVITLIVLSLIADVVVSFMCKSLLVFLIGGLCIAFETMILFMIAEFVTKYINSNIETIEKRLGEEDDED